MQQKTPTQVELFIDPNTQKSRFDEVDPYFNIPSKYFTVESGTIYLDAEICTKLDWIVYEITNGTANVATRAQQVEINGELRNINPGLGGLVDAEAFPAASETSHCEKSNSSPA